MNELARVASNQTEELFLKRSGFGLGSWPWDRCWRVTGNVRAGRARHCRRQHGGLPGLPHFPPKAKRVIYLFQSGAPSQMDLFDDKPAICRTRRGIELPDSVRMGQRITTMTSGQKSFPVAPSIFKFRPARPERRLAQRAAAAHRGHRRRYLHHPLDADRGDQSRPGDHLRPDRLAARRPAQHGGLGRLWPGQREPGPAGLRRAALARPDRSAALRPALGKRVPAHPLSRRQASRRQGAGALSRQPRRLQPRRCAGRCSTSIAALDELASRRDRRPRDRDPRRAVRAGLPDADARFPS